MNSNKAVRITGMGKYLPSNKVDSTHLEAKLNIPAGWSLRYSGVRTRYHVQDESGAVMGARALEEALQQASLNVSELDLLICGSATFDYVIPNQACLIKAEIVGGKASDVPVFVVNSTCLSFVSALDMASRFLDGRQYQHIGIVSTEICSHNLNPDNWETATLFGDGAAAAIVSWMPDSGSHLIHASMKTWSEEVFDTTVKGGGNAFPVKDHPYDPALYAFAMKGKRLLRLAKEKIPLFMDHFFEELEEDITDINLIIPHQASKLGLGLFRNMYAFSDTQFFSNLETHGNCISSSIPMALYDAIQSHRLVRGDTCLLCGTSAGFSVGAVLLRY